MISIPLEPLKDALALGVSFAAEKFHSIAYLATGPVEERLKTEGAVRECFNKLKADQKEKVYGKVWELAKMQDPRIDGARWGEEHAFENGDRLSKALHRLGFLGTENLHPMHCLPFGFGEGGLGSQYFSLGEKLGKDSEKGQIGLVNGMGINSLEHAGKDAALFSDHFASGHNVHCIYNPTHQTFFGDLAGVSIDVLRMKATDGGSYTKTSYLIVQQWIDFLDAQKDKNFLQVGVSEGAAHINAALRMVKQVRPELLSRIRILNLCPAYFILPENYEHKIQVINLVKKEDIIIIPLATNADKIGISDHIKVVPHTTSELPHYQLSVDYRVIAKPYIDAFIRTGNLY